MAQSAWNVDKLDGTGASGITVDPTKSQIFVFDFEWLGVGRVRTGLVVDGKIYYFHYFSHANVTNVVYMSTPNLPLRYELENDGTGGIQSPVVTSRYLGAAIDGTLDEIYLCWLPTVGANQDIEGSLTWREL